jgi:excisionase family DNA binding protein
MPKFNHSFGNTMNSKTSSNEILDDTSAAAYIGGIKARTIRDWRTCRGLPFIRITSKVIRIRRADLDEWLERHRVAIIRTRHRENWPFGSG